MSLKSEGYRNKRTFYLKTVSIVLRQVMKGIVTSNETCRNIPAYSP